MPINKILKTAAEVPPYFNILKQQSLQEKIIKVIRREDKQILFENITPLRWDTDLGEPCSEFQEKKDTRSAI
jgi:hypothetical protein